jgi:hypothetical protein
MILQSEDTESLDQFEDYLVTIAGPVDSVPSPPVVFYLKYTRPDDAIWMLAELLDGGEASSLGDANSLVNGFVGGSSDSLLGSLVSSREGTTTMIAGSITVVADSRLNRLIVQGTASDVEQVENYLKIIDKDISITSIETYGTSHVVELVYSRASEVADVIRSAYEGRVAGSAPGVGQGQPGGAQPGQRPAPQPEKQDNDKKSSKKRIGRSASKNARTEDDDRRPRTKQLADCDSTGPLVPRSRATCQGHRFAKPTVCAARESSGDGRDRIFAGNLLGRRSNRQRNEATDTEAALTECQLES